MLYDWTDNTENVQIKSAALPSQKEKIRRINEKMFMDGIQSFGHIPKKEWDKKQITMDFCNVKIIQQAF